MIKNKKNQTLIVITGSSCNNRCIMCSVRGGGSEKGDRTTTELVEILEDNRSRGYNKVEFTGGEPTVRNDIFELISKAKSLGYERVGLGTNGRMLAYKDFCARLVESGLDTITFTLLSSKAKNHDSIVATPGAFDQTIQGLKNCLRIGLLNVNVNTVLLRQNSDFLTQLGFLLASLGVDCWSVANLLPAGYGGKRYKFLSLSPAEIGQVFLSQEQVLAHFGRVSFYDFPLCLFPSSFFEKGGCFLFTAREKKEQFFRADCTQERFSFDLGKRGSYSDAYRKMLKVCHNCMYRDRCGGVWKKALSLYGGKSYEKMARDHGILK